MPNEQAESKRSIAALAGRRTDAVDTDIIRFPLSNVEVVGDKLRDLFLKRNAYKLICSAACGADLIALDVAGRLGIERHIILPFSITDFRRISVTDRPGSWGPLYDRIISEVAEQGLLQLLGCDTNDEDAFSKANKAIITQAKSFVSSEDEPLAIVVWEDKKPTHDSIDATREFLELAQEASFDEVTVKSV